MVGVVIQLKQSVFFYYPMGVHLGTPFDDQAYVDRNFSGSAGFRAANDPEVAESDNDGSEADETTSEGSSD